MNNKIITLLLSVLVAAACKKSDIPRVPPGEGSIVYKEVNQILGYKQPVSLYIDGEGAPDVLLNSVLMEANDKPYVVLTVSAPSQSRNSTIVSTQTTTGDFGFWSSPLKEGYTIFENATGMRNWTKPQEKGYLAAIMDDGNTKEFNGLWIDKQKRYVGVSLYIRDNKHYGWICISHNSGTKQFVIHDLAYNNKPGAVIRAGQKKDGFEGWIGEPEGKEED